MRSRWECRVARILKRREQVSQRSCAVRGYEIDRVGGGHRMGVEVALRLLTTLSQQGSRLCWLFDTFSRNDQSQSMAKSHQGTDQRERLRLAIHIVDEAAIDLDLVDL